MTWDDGCGGVRKELRRREHRWQIYSEAPNRDANSEGIEVIEVSRKELFVIAMLG